MSPCPVLIIADSRGRNLTTELNKFFHTTEYYLYWRKGLRLGQTAMEVSSIVLHIRPKMVYILNGICDLTKIRSYDPWTIAMRSVTAENAVNNYLLEVDSLLSQLYSLSANVGHPLMIIFAPLTGVNIGAYNQYPDDLPSPEQPTLNASIHMINKRIHALNTAMGIVTPPLSSATHQRCRGKYRFISRMLYDGCHPTQELCFYWAQKIYDNVQKNNDKYDRYFLANQLYN